MVLETTDSGQKKSLAAKRFNIPEAPTIASLTFPVNVTSFVAKNVGINIIRFNFNDDSNSNYWELKAGEETPVINIIGSTTIHATCIGDTGVAQCLFWG